MSDEKRPSNRCHYCRGRMRPQNCVIIHVDGLRRKIPGALMDMLSFEGETPRAFHYSCLVRYSSGLDGVEAEALHAAIGDAVKDEVKRTARPDTSLIRKVLRDYIAAMPAPVVEQRDSNTYNPSLDEDDA